MMITIYTSPTCGKCKTLKARFKQKNINFIESEDFDSLPELDFTGVPVVQIDNKYLDFSETWEWLKTQEDN